MASAISLTQQFNKEARREIEIAGRPRFEDPEGKPYSMIACYDPVEVWGCSPEEVAEFVAAAKREMLRYSYRPWRWRRAAEARVTFWRWKCREAAMRGISIQWY